LKISRTNLYAFVLSPFLFGFSFFLVSNYLYGDQVVYRELFDALDSARFSEVFYLSIAIVSGAEPISAILLWVGASLGFDKDVYVSLFNLGLMLGLFYFLRANRAPWYVIFLVFTNYYLLVLLTGAERLKFAYFFLLLAACTKGKVQVLFLSVAPLAHFQSLILLVGIASGYTGNAVRVLFKRWVFPKKYLYFGIVFFILIFVFLALFGQSVFYKAAIYMRSSDGMAGLFQVLVLLVLALLVTKDRLRIFLALLPIIVAVFLLGGNRVNMVAFSVVFYFLALERRLTSVLFLTILFYLSFKSVGFLENVILYGDGYYR
jgi:hypothetical protein